MINFNGVSLFSITILLVCSVTNTKAAVTIVDNGYSGVVVAISSSIAEKDGLPLVDTIKDIFIKASQVLYTATKGQFYFKEVSILVPSSWNNSNYTPAGFESFNKADVQIENSDYEEPFTVQYEGCGKRGNHISYNANHLKAIKFIPESADKNSVYNPGKTFVHEWAHYRYGIFDESGSQQVYFDNDEGINFPNICADIYPLTRFWDFHSDHPCDYLNNGQPDENCSFQVVENRPSTTSLMSSLEFLTTVQYFCDESNHKKNAPNTQNRLCDRKSAWEVIKANPDFKLIDKTQIGKITDVTPKFEIIQNKLSSVTVILVLDISGSMDEGEPYSRLSVLADTVSRWINEEVKIGWSIGIIVFESYANLVFDITRINNEQDRQELLKHVPRVADGGTCISCGLDRAITALKEYLKQPGGHIILVSDGEDGILTHELPRLLKQMNEWHIRVISIAFTKSSDQNMESLAKDTRGKVFFVGDKEAVKGLSSAFYDIADFQQEVDVSSSIKLSETSFSNMNNISVSGYFVIDATVGTNTTVNFVYQVENDITNIVISSPNEEYYILSELENATTDFASASRDTTLKLIKFKFLTLLPGRYNYVITTKKSPNQVIIANVMSSASSDDIKPITARCWITEENRDNGAKVIVVYAEVKQGQQPVIDATVTAEITTPSLDVIIMTLQDNGNGDPDIFKNDGIYSKYYTKTAEVGRYSLKTIVTAKNSTKISVTAFAGSNSRINIKKNIKIQDRPTGDFERISDGGSFQITHKQILADVFPPAKVLDLALKNVDEANSSITIQWTAPGDDLDHGNATKYELKYSNNYTLLTEDFNGTVVNFTTPPQESGNLEIHTILIAEMQEDLNQVFHLALKTVDDADLWSPMSNVITFRGNVTKPRIKSTGDGVGNLGPPTVYIIIFLYVIVSVFC